MSTYQKQPFKSFYLLWEAFTTTFIRAPLWILFALPSSNRPRPSWSLERVLRVKLMQYQPYVIAKTGLWWKEPDYRAIEHGADVKGIWILPVPRLIVGEVKQWAASANVEAVRIPGYWLEKEGVDLPVGAPPKPGEKVLYALHGGGFSVLSAHPDAVTSNIPRGLLKHARPDIIRALTLEYRLSKHRSVKPSNPFPAALLDAIAGYSYLIDEVGFAPEDIVLEGDSAGGNLAIALVRYLIENQSDDTANIPRPPGALILLSPWVDLGPAPKAPSSSAQANVPSDVIAIANRGTLAICDNYFGPLGRSAGVTNRYISPASTSPSMEHVSFKEFPRTFILSGGAEVLLDQIRVLHERMKTDLGPDLITYLEARDAVHDFSVYMWHEPERTECLRIIAKWIESEQKEPRISEPQSYVPKARL